MRNKNFKQSNGKLHGEMPVYVNNKKIMISRWKANWIERIAILITGNVWIKIDSRKLSHRPQVQHPFIGLENFRNSKKKGFRPFGEY